MFRRADIATSVRTLARRGIFVEPTCATAAVLDELARRGAIKPPEATVPPLTGTGIKATPLIAELL